MRARISDEIIRTAMEMYLSGDSLVKISKNLGVSDTAISNNFKRVGFETRKTSKGRPAHNKIEYLPEGDICAEYIGGDSENQISKKYNVSRCTIRRILMKHNVETRNQSESEKIKWSNMSGNARANQVRNCHAASKGSKNSIEHRNKIAVARSKNPASHHIGVGEIELKFLLESCGVEFEHQKPVLGYNLDFFLLGVDLEITSFAGRNAHFRKKPKERAINIFNESAIHTLAVEIKSANDVCLFFSEILSCVYELSKEPKSHCLYWVANCTDNGFKLLKHKLEI